MLIEATPTADPVCIDKKSISGENDTENYSKL